MNTATSKMPPIGFGTFPLTGADARAAVETALELGFRHIDTAQWYDNESDVGGGDRPADVVLGQPWFRSWVLVLGLVPYDRMHITPVVLDADGRRFVEESTMLWMRAWRHERFVEAVDDGCRLTDRLTPTPRIPGFGPVVRAFVRVLFRHRHRRLRARFSG